MRRLHLSFVVAALLATQLYAEEASEVELKEVTVVSATGFEQNIKDAPATISVISKDEIEKKNHKDVADVVKDVPGVYSAPRFSSMKG